MNRRRLAAVVGALVVVGLGLVPVTAAAGPAGPAGPTVSIQPRVAGAEKGDGYRSTHAVTRSFAGVDGTPTEVSSHDVTVTADHTRNLRGRQRVHITWSGAQPSAARASIPYGENGLLQEYPVVVMQCRGVDNPRLPAAQQIRPETCWTASVAQRSQLLRSSGDATWIHDRYAGDADKRRVSGLDPVPQDKCPNADIDPYYTHLTPFVARNRTVYPACSADQMPPEASVGGAYLPAELAAFTDANGNGSVDFEVRGDSENESLGCSNKVKCSIVVIPIAGLSCDTPSSPQTASDKSCRRTGRFAPGSSNFAADGIDLAVGPALWWSQSNWRNRFTIPITFGLPPDTCDILDPRPPTGFAGSELLAQAGLQWAPSYCLDKSRFKFQLNQMSDEAGFDLMQSGDDAAAVVSSKHETTITTDPVGYAPTAVTGFAIGYIVDKPDNAGEFTQLKLNARLIAKLLTESYTASDLGRGHPGMGDNPLAIMADPEFIKLNKGLSTNAQEAGATLLSLSNSSDVIQQLTEYIAQDKDAMAFVNGKPDPWGMVVNPSYRGLDLPTAEIPLLDEYVPETQSKCRQENPGVYLSQVAAPVSYLRVIAEALLDAWPNVQTRCDIDGATGLAKTGRIDRQSFGARFMLGLVSLGDAKRYGLRSAALQTSPGKYVAPTTDALSAAVGLTEQTKRREPFALDQADVVRQGSAYPGTMVVYTAARLRNLDQADADKVAQFIRIATTEGQRPGSGNGQLPEGFLPIRKTGPTAKLFASAQDVADAVEAQKAPSTTPDSDDTDTDTDDPGTDTNTPGGPGGPPGTSGLPSTGDDALPAPGATDPNATDGPTPASSEEPLADAAPVSSTGGVVSGLMGKLIPALLIVGVLSLLYKASARFLPRPPGRKT